MTPFLSNVVPAGKEPFKTPKTCMRKGCELAPTWQLVFVFEFDDGSTMNGPSSIFVCLGHKDGFDKSQVKLDKAWQMMNRMCTVLRRPSPIQKKTRVDFHPILVI